MAYGDLEDLNRRTSTDQLLCDKAFNIAKTPKYGDYKCELASMVYNFFDKKKTSGETVKNEYPKQLLENLIKEKYTLLLYRICRYAIDK